MNNLEESTMPLSRNPKQPSTQPGQSLPYRKRLLVRLSEPPPVSAEPPFSTAITVRLAQPLAHANLSSLQGNETHNRSPLSDFATIKIAVVRSHVTFVSMK